jgi:deoxyribodipyrimidine photo-lyase
MGKQSIFIFTRDLRLRDHLALNEAIRWSDEPVICIFIFRKIQIGKDNEYRSDNSIEFMMESLKDLEVHIKEKGGRLWYLYEEDGKRPNGSLLQFLEPIVAKRENVRVYMSRGITPYAQKREDQMDTDLQSIHCELHLVENHLLNEKTRDIRTSSGGIYTVFKPFYEKVLKNGVPKPVSLPRGTEFMNSLRGVNTREISKNLRQMRMVLPYARVSVHRIVNGGEQEGLNILKKVKTLRKYNETRDTFSLPTTHLSAYNHYGCVSVRDVYHSLKHIPAITRQLVFREYAYHQMMGWGDTGWRDPREIGESIPWVRDRKLEHAWKHGKTGVPIVDAGMRQLFLEGYIHNRARMAVANFLVKNLNIHWRVGERYFAQWLTDYDWSVNFMNWIQIASILPTDQYSRGMNPYIQAKKHDPDLTYILKYVPELRDADPKEVFDQERTNPIGDYPAPIVNYKKSKMEYLKWGKKHIRKFHPGKED